MTPDQVRSQALEQRLRIKLMNLCTWWGVSPSLALVTLDHLRGDLANQLQSGSLKWPDPSEACYAPGTPNDELRAMAYEGAAALAAAGVPLSARRLWRWLREHGVRKRQSDGLRIVGNVVAIQRAGEVAAAYVRGDKPPT